MKKICTFLFLLTSGIAFAQPRVTKIEDFPIGWKLIFRNVNPSGLLAGNAGANQTWNFSGMTLNPDSTTEIMVPAQWTSKGGDFPASTMVEKYSNGQFVYVNNTGSENYLLGYVDTTSGLELKYGNGILFVKRPTTYQDSFLSDFNSSYSVGSLDFKGKGTMRVLADGYGTLILPNGSFNNVLRIKTIQNERDTLQSGGPSVNVVTTTYTWFDTVHYSALLKIDSTNYGTAQSKAVQYLLSEGLSGINTEDPEPYSTVMASIYNNRLLISGGLKPGTQYEATLYDILGRAVTQTQFKAANGAMQSIQIPQISKGTYILNLKDENGYISGTKIISE